jgi:hypothetical protein
METSISFNPESIAFHNSLKSEYANPLVMVDMRENPNVLAYLRYVLNLWSNDDSPPLNSTPVIPNDLAVTN